ncbi:NAD(P)H-quinone oxidoreductase [candidate division KSB1 bacterium]|nr:NAD(P)H-quinone oxidoreductase [candidate division KSB1 bacterium]NIR69532.1 NAD(P)H-quinone oxidoreductase [candidate division KSB1 bacterium]NIS24300.1 NAD(P)H-quinone oxidoreductase [candidate division KSB1 bacterium]NIT71215.1 NAD(P)H-quinone oxidoreductase [candidate division KSB1 bacterium]NIU24919.1 NAD(P)H-quinone oxidoreductase [candidate division KSB1 bacterium]
MRAIVITKPGDPSVLQLQDIAEPEPAADHILVRVHATALNRADVLQRMGRYPPPQGVRPDVPGLEFAGEVEAIGEKVEEAKVGDRVMGLLPGEGYAEKIVTPERMVLPIPDNLTHEEAAAIPEVFLTAYDALFAQLDLRFGERLLIHAVGSGVGTAALQLAKTAGATVFGTAGSDDKLQRAAELGLDVAINYKTQDFQEIILKETQGQGVHGILDVVGASYWEKNLTCLTTKGRMVLVGLLSGANTGANLAQVLTKRLRIIGTVLRARAFEEKIALTQTFKECALPSLASGKIKPVIDRTFSLEQAAEAHVYMEANKNFGKIVLQVRE